MGAWESLLTAVHSAAPRCSLTALKMSDCNTGAVGRDRIISLCCVTVYYPDLYSQWALRSVASSHTANYPIHDKQQVNQRSPPVPMH